MTEGASLRGPLVCIVGPTASGKSSLAELVASKLGSSVISVDAMQVYRGMDIGTAKTPEGERKVPLLMVDVADVSDDYSVQRFQVDARRCVEAELDGGRIPVLCGGTGLYLNAVIDKMEFPAGTIGSERRSAYERLAAEEGSDALYQLLASRDPESAALIHPHNVRRVVRALEMLDEGVSYAKHHEGLSTREPYYDARVWGLRMDRSRLYERIDRRVDQMFDEGLVQEVQSLVPLGLSADKTSGQAIGYKEVLEALDGACSLEEARENVKRRTRHYAKRQLSWFGHDKRVRWIDLDKTTQNEAVRAIVDDVVGTNSGTSEKEA